MQQARHFREESLTLKTLIADLDDADFEKTTQFKSWTINDVFRHLHFWNKAVMVATEGDEAFAVFFEDVGAHMMKGGSLPEYEKAYLDGLSGGALREAWADVTGDLDLLRRLCGSFEKRRVACIDVGGEKIKY